MIIEMVLMGIHDWFTNDYKIYIIYSNDYKRCNDYRNGFQWLQEMLHDKEDKHHIHL